MEVEKRWSTPLAAESLGIGGATLATPNRLHIVARAQACRHTRVQ
jgi:hypothetical protein